MDTLRVGCKVFQISRVGAEQDQCAKASRTNGIALGDSLCGVANRVERVRGFTNVVGQFRHFGNAASVIRNRAISVKRHNHASQAPTWR